MVSRRNSIHLHEGGRFKSSAHYKRLPQFLHPQSLFAANTQLLEHLHYTNPRAVSPHCGRQLAAYTRQGLGWSNNICKDNLHMLRMQPQLGTVQCKHGSTPRTGGLVLQRLVARLLAARVRGGPVGRGGQLGEAGVLGRGAVLAEGGVLGQVHLSQPGGSQCVSGTREILPILPAPSWRMRTLHSNTMCGLSLQDVPISAARPFPLWRIMAHGHNSMLGWRNTLNRGKPHLEGGEVEPRGDDVDERHAAPDAPPRTQHLLQLNVVPAFQPHQAQKSQPHQLKRQQMSTCQDIEICAKNSTVAFGIQLPTSTPNDAIIGLRRTRRRGPTARRSPAAWR